MKKIGILLVGFLLLVSIGTASALTVGNLIIDRPVFDGATNIAFIDPTLEFTTGGTLDSWDVWLKADVGDEWALQIYRYTGTTNLWEVVYTPRYTIGDSTDAAWNLEGYGFEIQAGDVVGWWFGEGGGTIPFTVTGGDDVEWTNYSSPSTEIKFPGAPNVGDIYNFNTAAWSGSSQKREYSIAANYTPAPVPEPATMLLFGLGLVGLAGVSRKKQ